MTLRVCSTHS